MVSMERELNKLFNDTNYNKENVIIREIWSIKLELQNFSWGVYALIKVYQSYICFLGIIVCLPLLLYNRGI